MGSWRSDEDPLFRGDVASGVQLPVPKADRSIVRHVLYLEGFGRPTPYVSTSESRDVAGNFAYPGGRVYTTRVPEWTLNRVRHISQAELCQLLRGSGKGDASWPRAFEVAQARRYVEEWAEHLADFRGVEPEVDLRSLVDQLFVSSRGV
jgi:hypothetical protein